MPSDPPLIPGDTVMMIRVKRGQSGTPAPVAVVWQGTVEVLMSGRDEVDHYPGMFEGHRRVSCALGTYKGHDVFAVLLPAPDPAGRNRWTTLDAESNRISSYVSCREVETVDGDLIRDTDPEMAARITAAFGGRMRMRP